MSEAVVAAARAAIGTPFRLHGRDPAYGLDCVGLVALAAKAGGCAAVVPTGYALRSGDSAALAAIIDATGLLIAEGRRPGDILLCRAGPGQLHLAIDAGGDEGGIIHADAQLRRVVERPGPVPWPIIRRWRVANPGE